MIGFLFKPLAAKTYILGFLGLLGVIVFGFAGGNYLSNDFGLWAHRDAARIWELEKSSKYLLAMRYVPENFDSVLIGPSVSDNFDTRQIKERKVYNLSMAGGNATELRAAALEYIKAEDKPGAFIICLFPYMTRNSGMKSFQIHEKDYYGSLFSLIPVTLWVRKAMHKAGLMHKAYEESEAGWHHYDIRFEGKDFPQYKAFLQEEADKLRALDDPRWPEEKLAKMIDPQAEKELKEIIDAARVKGFQIYAFYYPFNGWAMERMELTGEWEYYKNRIGRLFTAQDIVWDFNTEEYETLRYDEEAYIDSHLSQKGASFVLKDISEKLRQGAR